MSRCQLLAEAIVRAADPGRGNRRGALCAIEDRFAQAGIDLDAPYLNPSP